MKHESEGKGKQRHIVVIKVKEESKESTNGTSQEQEEEKVAQTEESNGLLIEHARLAMASKVERTKMLDTSHVQAFHGSSHGAEFREFC